MRADAGNAETPTSLRQRREVGNAEYKFVAAAASTLKLERDFQLGPVGFDLTLGVQLQIERDNLGDAKVAEGFSGPGDGRGGRLFPGVLAGTDQFDNLVD